MGDSGTLQVGELVLAIGNPFGLSQTVTMGIISAVGRTHMGTVDYEYFIQTDAAINPGNSGGPLVNLRGELIGINTAIYRQSGGYMGIGFAIPSNMVKNVMYSLIKTGKVLRGVDSGSDRRLGEKIWRSEYQGRLGGRCGARRSWRQGRASAWGYRDRAERSGRQGCSPPPNVGLGNGTRHNRDVVGVA
jgi:hypothetical protein